jgi:hypothetical protein
MKIFVSVILPIFLFIVSTQGQTQSAKTSSEDLHASIQQLTQKKSSLGKAIQIRKIVRQEHSFEQLITAIQCHKSDMDEKPGTGILKWTIRTDSLNHYAVVMVPLDYDPQKKYPVDFILHGAVSTPNPHAVDTYVQTTHAEVKNLQHIVVYPSGWVLAPWWSKTQLQHLDALLRKLKTHYNVDENRIYLSGISDGGTGCAYVANYQPTPWACYQPYISNPTAIPYLSQEALYIQNLKSNAFFFLSTQNDALFPPEKIRSFTSMMKKAGIPHQLTIIPGHGHNVKWFEEYRDSIRHFKKAHPRNPYPDSLTWHCHDVNYGRNHWVIVEKTGQERRPKETAVLQSKNKQTKPYGTIEVKRLGNRVEVKTTNVKQYRLLISPQQFNMDKTIEVFTNGKLSFRGKLKPNAKTLLKWYWHDRDRTMLFGGEIKVKI